MTTTVEVKRNTAKVLEGLKKKYHAKRIYTENVKDFEGIPWIEAVNPMAGQGPGSEVRGPRAYKKPRAGREGRSEARRAGDGSS